MSTRVLGIPVSIYNSTDSSPQIVTTWAEATGMNEASLDLRMAAGSFPVFLHLEDSGSTGMPVPDSPRARLLRRRESLIRRAREYQDKHGNPVDKLQSLLSKIVQDEEVWQEILDEPYG